MKAEELRGLAVGSVEAEVRFFGGCSARCSVVTMPGVVASLSPATPERSIFNSALAARGALDRAYDELATTYREAGVRAWTVWVPDDDRAAAWLLADRGHLLDGVTRAMALELGGLRPRSLPDGYEAVRGDLGTVGAINDRAYGIEGPGFAAAISEQPRLSLHSFVAVGAGEAVACAGVIDRGDDACVTAVATLPEHRGRGLAGALISLLLAAAAERGARTASLRASRAGAPVYERLGFVDLGSMELWERREG